MEIFVFCMGFFIGLLATCGVMAYFEGKKIEEVEREIEELKKRMSIN